MKRKQAKEKDLMVKGRERELEMERDHLLHSKRGKSFAVEWRE